MFRVFISRELFYITKYCWFYYFFCYKILSV